MAHSFAAGAAWHYSDSADCYTGAGVHSSGSSGGTNGVATHAKPAKMDARRGTSGALDCSPSSVQGDVCYWGPPPHGGGADLGLVQESGGGSVHRPMQHLYCLLCFSLAPQDDQPLGGETCPGQRNCFALFRHFVSLLLCWRERGCGEETPFLAPLLGPQPLHTVAGSGGSRLTHQDSLCNLSTWYSPPQPVPL